MEDTPQYDVLILGAGPAGFTAGIYLARFKFRTLLLDYMPPAPGHQTEEAGRSSVHGIYRSVPGYPNGIEREELKWCGIHQAQNMGCDYRIDKALSITRQANHFTVHCETGEYTSKYLFFALGVQDIWPDLPGLARYTGSALFWSVESNGKEAEGKIAGVIGSDDHAALEAVKLHDFASRAYLLTHGQPLSCSEEMERVMAHLNIPVVDLRIKTVVGTNSDISSIILENNQEIDMEILYTSAQFRTPRSHMAQELGIHVDTAGYIHVNERYETSIPGVYAIGDITSRGPEQVVTSYYQGMHASWALYEEVFRKKLQQLLGASQSVSH